MGHPHQLPPLLPEPHHHVHHVHHHTFPSEKSVAPRPSSTPQTHHHHHHHVHAKKEKEGEMPSRKRNRAIEEASLHAPSNDRNSWYYPALLRPEAEDEDEDELAVGTSGGNWGNKHLHGSRWVRRGKKAPWGPGRDAWEVEDRARKRIKRMIMPSTPSTPPPPSLPHARSPTPPLVAPYTPPLTQHPNFSSFVLDPSVQHSFRSGLIADLERTAGELIEGESGLRRALGRLWRVLADETLTARPKTPSLARERAVNGTSLTEEEEEEEEEDVDDDDPPRLTPVEALQRIFIAPNQDVTIPGPPGAYEHPIVLNTQQQWEMLERSLAAIRDLQDDGRECVERLEEIREDLGAVRGARKVAWTIVRTRALEEMEADD